LSRPPSLKPCMRRCVMSMTRSDKENEIKAGSRILKRILSNVDEGRARAKLAKSELIKANLASGGQHCQKVHQPRTAVS
jgi:hypothetical protein